MSSRTKILAWNVRYFDIDKIASDVDPMDRGQSTEDRMSALTTLYNDIYLWWTITAMDPDIFIMTELLTDGGELGTLATGKGALGALKVLADLRRANAAWCLVPPTRVNHVLKKRKGKKRSTYTECVGVFYRSDRLEFTGPWYWPAGASSSGAGLGQVAVEAGPGGDYPDIWADCLPADCKRAGRVVIKDSKDVLVDFVERAHRRPFFTTFRERHDAERNIHLASVHMLPLNTQNKPSTIRRAMKKVVTFFPQYQPIGAKTVCVIAGDFNLNRNLNTVESDLYAGTGTTASQWLIPPGYVSSYRPVDYAVPDHFIADAINDNAIVWYTSDLPVQPKTGLVGDLAGGQAAYINEDLWDGAKPQVPRTIAMKPEVAASYPLDDETASDQLVATFQSPANFGHVGRDTGISDHMPICFQV